MISTHPVLPVPVLPLQGRLVIKSLGNGTLSCKVQLTMSVHVNLELKDVDLPQYWGVLWKRYGLP